MIEREWRESGVAGIDANLFQTTQYEQSQTRSATCGAAMSPPKDVVGVARLAARPTAKCPRTWMLFLLRCLDNAGGEIVRNLSLVTRSFKICVAEKLVLTVDELFANALLHSRVVEVPLTRRLTCK